MKKVWFLLISMVLLVSLGAGCFSYSDSSALQITTSFYPLYYFTSEIARENAEVINLTPAGVEPHDFEPTARDSARLQSSKLLIVNGRGFEPWVEKVKNELEKKGTKIVSVSEQVSNTQDPHVWLSPILAKKEVEILHHTLAEIDPTHQESYQKNTEELLQKLEQLDKEFRNGLAACQRTSFITAHAAFGHLATSYGLTQMSIAGLSPDAEPSSRQLADLIAFAKANHIQYIFFESLVSPKLAETLAKEVGAETLVLNPLEGLTQEEIKAGKDYFSVMRENLANLRKGLGCR